MPSNVIALSDAISQVSPLVVAVVAAAVVGIAIVALLVIREMTRHVDRVDVQTDKTRVGVRMRKPEPPKGPPAS